MFTRPEDLSDEEVAGALSSGWDLAIDQLDHAPVGFGSHHWRLEAGASRWFVTVDDLELGRRNQADTRAAVRDRLVAALGTAAALRADGCAFVVAPVASASGRLVEPIDDRWAVALYPEVDGAAGASGRFERGDDRLVVVDRLVELHRSATAVPAQADDLSIPWRDGLAMAMGELDTDWTAGPFARRARDLLRRHEAPLRAVLDAYDDLVAVVRARPEALVVTHGEPHAGNVLATADGPMLIDWDTARLAHPERDLWNLIEEDPEVRAHYERRSGRALDDPTLRLHRLWWDLCEVTLYVQDFRRPHGDTADTRTAWGGLEHHLDPGRWTDLIGPPTD